MNMLKTLLLRAAGHHLLKNHQAAHGDGHLQSVVEGLILRVVVAGSLALYKASPRFAAALDQVADAVAGISAQ